MRQGFRVAEMLPEFHRYHLDDDPELTSCSLVVERKSHNLPSEYASEPYRKISSRTFTARIAP